MKILIDANFIIGCLKEKIDFVSLADEITTEKVEWLVPKEVVEELNKIGKGKGISGGFARVGIDLLNGIGAKVVNLKGKGSSVDNKIVNYVSNKKIVVATMDKGLKKRLDNKVLSIRGKKKLEIV